jgi:glyoxylase-like metal-dependent hydrolase (beta-lactamase superfamily II)
MTELAKDVHMVEGSVGCNTYILIDTDGVTLIDTGLRGNVSKIYSKLNRLGYGPQDIRRIIITHAHLDHINCLHRLKEDSKAIIMVSEKDAPVVSGEKPLRTLNGIMGMMFGMIRTYYRYKPVNVDAILMDGDDLKIQGGLKVVSLIGHEEGNIGLYCPSKRYFITSDSIRVSNGKLIPPHPKFTADMQAAIRSIGRIAEYDFEMMMPGHGPPVLSGASDKVKALFKELKAPEER